MCINSFFAILCNFTAINMVYNLFSDFFHVQYTVLIVRRFSQVIPNRKATFFINLHHDAIIFPIDATFTKPRDAS